MAKPYSAVEEIDAAALPNANRMDPDRLAFFNDVLLRLERTRKDKAIRYLFPDKDTARKFLSSVHSRTHRAHGAGFVHAGVIPSDDPPAVYVYFRRGPNYPNGNGGKG